MKQYVVLKNGQFFREVIGNRPIDIIVALTHEFFPWKGQEKKSWIKAADKVEFEQQGQINTYEIISAEEWSLMQKSPTK